MEGNGGMVIISLFYLGDMGGIQIYAILKNEEIKSKKGNFPFHAYEVNLQLKKKVRPILP